MIIGSIVALVTPMLPETEAIDYPALRRLVDWHQAAGTAAIVAVGTTGESPTLSVEEHLRVIEVCVEQAAGRLPIIAGTGANSTSEAIDLTAGARERGADACLLVTPYYNKPTQEGLYLHHRAIAEAVDIAQVLYNVPGRTGCDMLPDTVVRLAQIPNIVGIKEATGDLERARDLVARCPEDFAVYSGDDATAMDLMLLGGKGNIGVTANVAPAQMRDLCDAALAGDRVRAEAINDRLLALHWALFLESNPIPVKWAVAELGLMADVIRLPLTPLSPGLHARVREAMHSAGLL
ncbi:MAG: 4-hydroxy-tetrahydrodipicolinate synthase [Gammaproteobacteria bacterium]